MTASFTGHALAAQMNVQTRVLLDGLERPARMVLLQDPAHEAARAYARRIGDYAALLGIELRLEDYTSVAAIDALAEDPMTDAILPLRPMPATLVADDVIHRIGAARDAEGQHPLNLGALMQGQGRIAPPTARAAYLCAVELAGDLRGRRVGLVGASSRVGTPLALLLSGAGATVSIAQEHTVDLREVTGNAEIVISATGVAGLIRGEHIAEGAILLDVGIIATPQGLVGDIDRESVSGRAAVLSAVPDGVGPVTTACLMRNVALLAAQRDKGLG